MKATKIIVFNANLSLLLKIEEMFVDQFSIKKAPSGSVVFCNNEKEIMHEMVACEDNTQTILITGRVNSNQPDTELLIAKAKKVDNNCIVIAHTPVPMFSENIDGCIERFPIHGDRNEEMTRRAVKLKSSGGIYENMPTESIIEIVIVDFILEVLPCKVGSEIFKVIDKYKTPEPFIQILDSEKE